MKQALFMLLLCTGCAWGFSQQRPQRVPATPHPMEYIQPNGDTIDIRLRGDENFHFHTTLDGYKIVKDKKGYFRYAKERNGLLVPSCRKAHNQENRTKCEWNYLHINGIK